MEETKSLGSTNKLTLLDLKIFEDLIGNKMIKAEGIDFTYELSIELSKLRNYIKQQDSRIKITDDAFLFKDENQKPIMYLVETKNGASHFMLDVNNEWITLKDEKDKARVPYMHRIDLDNPQYKADIKKHTEDDINFTFKKLSAQKIKDLYQAGKFSGMDLSPLFGHLFDVVE